MKFNIKKLLGAKYSEKIDDLFYYVPGHMEKIWAEKKYFTTKILETIFIYKNDIMIDIEKNFGKEYATKFNNIFHKIYDLCSLPFDYIKHLCAKDNAIFMTLEQSKKYKEQLKEDIYKVEKAINIIKRPPKNSIFPLPPDINEYKFIEKYGEKK